MKNRKRRGKPEAKKSGRRAAAIDKRILYAAFFLAALLVRLAYVYSIRHLPTFDALELDSKYHHETALLIAGGDWLGGDQPFFRSPLYIYFLAVIYKLFGVGFMAPRIVGAVVGACSVVLVVRIAEKLFTRRAAVFAGVLAVFCWPVIFFDAELLATSLTLLFGLILLLLFIRAHERPSLRNMVVLGLFFGVAAVTRENYLPIIPLAFLFFVVLQRRLLPASLFLAFALLAVSPVTIRNYVVLDDIVPITHYTGVNFYIGNNPYADGRTAIIPFSPGSWWGGVEYANNEAREHYGRPIKPSDVSVYWFGKTFDYVADNVGHFLGNAVKKFFLIFDIYEYSNNKQIYFFRDLSSVLGFPLFFPFSGFLFIPLGLLGMGLSVAAGNKRALPLYLVLAGYVVGLSLGFVNSRLRMPIVVMLIIFSGYAMQRLLAERQKLPARLAMIVAVVVFLLAVNKRPDGHFDRAHLAGHFILANAYLAKKKLDEAETHFLESVKLTRGEYEERSRNGLLNIEMIRGINEEEKQNWAAARKHFEQALIYGGGAAAQLRYARAVAAMDEEDALPHFLRLIEMSPNSPYGYVEVARYYLEQNDRAQAARYYAMAREKMPSSPSPELLGYIFQFEAQLRGMGEENKVE